MRNHHLLILLLMVVSINFTHAGYSETVIGIQGKDFVLLAADGSIGNGGAVLTSQSFDKIQIFPAAHSAIAGMGDPADIDYVLRKLQVKSRLAAVDHPTKCIMYDCSTGRHINTPPPKAAIWTVDCIAEALRYEVYSRLRTKSPMRECAFLIAGMHNNQHSNHKSPSTTDIANVQQQIQIASKDFRNLATDLLQESLVHQSNTPQETVAKSQPALFWLDHYGALQKVTYGVHGHAESLLWSVLDRGWRSDMSVEEAMDLLEDCLQRLKERFLFNPSQTFCIKCIDQNGCRRLA